MKSSQLAAIIRRLEAMQEIKDGEAQSRRFEKEGEERCQVSFDSKTEAYELEDRVSQQTYEFDDIDLVAMEIFDLLQD